MIILTCANTDKCSSELGKWYEGFSFKDVILKTVKKAKECGYSPVVYDLGSLGIGEPFIVENESFQKNGFYENEIVDGYKSRSLFKPEVVKKCFNNCNDLIVYLDGDAQLYKSIDEIQTNDYDIGVTLRDKLEFESDWYKEHLDIVRYVNAGVIFFQPSNASEKFIDQWERLTQEVGNDQSALNILVCPDKYPIENSIHLINNVRIKYFPGINYNYYYFEEYVPEDIKILHFKGAVRKYFPFDWRKRFFCKMVRPNLVNLRKYLNPLIK